MGSVKKAAQCTGTYLYLNPDQEDMKGNEVYYREVEGVKDILRPNTTWQWLNRYDHSQNVFLFSNLRGFEILGPYMK